jgi:hypothetical protein
MSAENMETLLHAVKALEKHPQLRSLSLVQLVEFLTRVSLLKRSILLAKRSAEPTDKPPEVLPRLIQNFLAKSVGIGIDFVPDAWSILKGYAWTMPTVSDWVENERAAFATHGWGKGLSEFALPVI